MQNALYKKTPRVYSEVLYARGHYLSLCVQTLAKNDLVHIVDIVFRVNPCAYILFPNVVLS